MTYATPQWKVASRSIRFVEDAPPNAERKTDWNPVAVLLEETL
jgi:hypothetical protein